MAKSICSFNHKGGVSKTTITYNLGWVLSKLGKNFNGSSITLLW